MNILIQRLLPRSKIQKCLPSPLAYLYWPEQNPRVDDKNTCKENNDSEKALL